MPFLVAIASYRNDRGPSLSAQPKMRDAGVSQVTRIVPQRDMPAKRVFRQGGGGVVLMSRVRLSGRAVVSVLKESPSCGKTPIDSC
jgi:hypothetical protein